MGSIKRELQSAPRDSIGTWPEHLFAFPDRLLDRVTMYRLVTWYLVALLGIAATLSMRGALGFTPLSIVATALAAVLVCVSINSLFATVWGAPLNSDSAIISGLILALIVGPAVTGDDFVFLAWASILAMASKYLLSWRHTHLFNPVAIAVVLTSLLAHQSASWWIADPRMTPFVIAGGVLVVRKLRRTDLVFTFLLTTLFGALAWSALQNISWQQALRQNAFETPAWFLGFVMLTEPVTMPRRKNGQMLYALLTGLLVIPQFHVGRHYFPPELALVIANLAMIPFRSFDKRWFELDRVRHIGPGLLDFVYRLPAPLAFQPGQYMEWTVDHSRADRRGKRRYFTLASSPTERDLRIGVKFERGGSSFKEAMLAQSRAGGSALAGQVAGDFTLPGDQTRKLAFIGGGIGITPFRSMAKYLTDRREPRDVVLIYAAGDPAEFVYRDVFDAAAPVLRFRTVYLLSGRRGIPSRWLGETGRVTPELIARQIPDYAERLFYISGSSEMVRATVDALHELGIGQRNIKTDYFSGLAS